MLKIDEWSFYEGRSEVDGNVVMRFYGQVDRNNPDNILITEKEEAEDSYRNNIDVIRKDRQGFQDKIYFEASRLKGLLGMIDAMNDTDEPNCSEISDNSDTTEGGVIDEV